MTGTRHTAAGTGARTAARAPARAQAARTPARALAPALATGTARHRHERRRHGHRHGGTGTGTGDGTGTRHRHERRRHGHRNRRHRHRRHWHRYRRHQPTAADDLVLRGGRGTDHLMVVTVTISSMVEEAMTFSWVMPATMSSVEGWPGHPHEQATTKSTGIPARTICSSTGPCRTTPSRSPSEA